MSAFKTVLWVAAGLSFGWRLKGTAMDLIEVLKNPKRCEDDPEPGESETAPVDPGNGPTPDEPQEEGP